MAEDSPFENDAGFETLGNQPGEIDGCIDTD